MKNFKEDFLELTKRQCLVRVMNTRVLRTGILCASCGGLCKGSSHVSLSESDDKNFECVLSSPFPFRAVGIAIYTKYSCNVLQSLKIGSFEVLAAPVPTYIFQPSCLVDQYVTSLSFNELDMELNLPTIQPFAKVTATFNFSVSDFFLNGVYLEGI